MVNTLIKRGANPGYSQRCKVSDGDSRKRFETSEYFIPDLMMAGEILKGISDIVKPLIQSDDTSAKKGKVLIGTVAGDIHDIGKSIVTFMLDVSGYDILDIPG